MIYDTPTEGALLDRIAAKAKVDVGTARAVLDEHGISLRPPMPADRRITLRRFVAEGEKFGVTRGKNGPFFRDIELGPGAWAIASTENSAGKSSLMWALAFALRGESDDVLQRPECFQWFRYIRLDAVVSGVPISVRLHIDSDGNYRTIMLTAESIDTLAALEPHQEEASGVGIVDAAEGKVAVAALMSRFMMKQLGLRPLELFAENAGAPREDGARDGTVQSHEWPAFFPLVSIMSASDSVLFGKNATGNIPVRLIQEFLDIPFVSELMSAGASSKLAKQQARHSARRAKEDAEVRAGRLGKAEEQLESARRRLRDLRGNVPDFDALRTETRAAAYAAARTEQRLAAATSLHAQGRQARIDDERRLRELSESAAARALFGALNPRMCPRCESPIDKDRQHNEHEHGQCAVCTSPVTVPDAGPEDREHLLGALRSALKASREAEAEAQSALDEADGSHRRAVARQREAQSALDAVLLRGDSEAQVRDAELEVARLDGAAQALAKLGYPEESQAEDVEAQVLAAANDILRSTARAVTNKLFDELNEEIVELARELGVANLDSVKLDTRGHVNPRKSGNPATFKGLSPGERLRLRIAIVITMIRVGRRYGIRSHPGLLLIDSPTDVEVKPGDVKIMLDQLVALGEELDGLQIVITTGHDAVWEAFPGSRLIVGDDREFLF